MWTYLFVCLLIVSSLLIIYKKKKKKSNFRIFCFYKIGVPPKESKLKQEWTSIEKLEKIIIRAKKSDLHFLPFSQINGEKVGKNSVCLTFIGGYQSLYTTVFSILKKYNVCATIFIPTDLIGSYNAWQNPYEEPWQNLLTIQQIKELGKNENIEFGVMPLQHEDVFSQDVEQASYLVNESLFRLKNLYKVTPVGIALAPTRKLSLSKIHSIFKKCSHLPILLPITGVNSINGKHTLLKQSRNFFIF